MQHYRHLRIATLHINDYSRPIGFDSIKWEDFEWVELWHIVKKKLVRDYFNDQFYPLYSQKFKDIDYTICNIIVNIEDKMESVAPQSAEEIYTACNKVLVEVGNIPRLYHKNLFFGWEEWEYITQVFYRKIPAHVQNSNFLPIEDENLDFSELSHIL